MKAVPEPALAKTEDQATDESAPQTDAEAAPKTEPEPKVEAPTEQPQQDSDESAPQAAAETDEGPEMEMFYTFSWRPKRRTGGERGHGQGKPQGKPRGKPQGKPQGKRAPRDQKAKTYQARPGKKEKKIDPDNPFAAALMGLKTKG